MKEGTVVTCSSCGQRATWVNGRLVHVERTIRGGRAREVPTFVTCEQREGRP